MNKKVADLKSGDECFIRYGSNANMYIKTKVQRTTQRQIITTTEHRFNRNGGRQWGAGQSSAMWLEPWSEELEVKADVQKRVRAYGRVKDAVVEAAKNSHERISASNDPDFIHECTLLLDSVLEELNQIGVTDENR